MLLYQSTHVLSAIVQIFLSQAGKGLFEAVVNDDAEVDKLIDSGVVSSIRRGGCVVMRVRSRQAKGLSTHSFGCCPFEYPGHEQHLTATPNQPWRSHHTARAGLIS
jgi:hypothetical protein